MSKNLTRKGLALGAIVALGSSLFAGAPAFAGVESTGVTLVPAAGTTYSSIGGAAFDLSTALSYASINAAGASASQLSYLITNADAAAVKVNFDGGLNANNSTAFKVNAAASAADNVAPATAGNTATELTGKSIVVTGGTGNVGGDSRDTAANKLTITTSGDATDNVVLKVQAFVDANGNGKIDDFDLVSTERTLTFIPAKNVTASSAITSSVIGSTKLAATVTLGNDINIANLGTAVTIKVQKNGADVNIGGAASTAVSYDSTDKVLTNLDTTIATITDATYIVQAYFGSVKLGAASNAVTPANGTVTSVDAVDAVAVTASANSLTTGVVRAKYTGNVTFTSKVLNSASAAVKVAGVKVKVTVTKGATFDSASTFVAGGKTLTATSGAVSFETTTDADGKISITGASSTGKAGDIVNVAFAALKSTGGYTVATNKDITYTAAAVSALKQTALVGTNAVVKTTVGGTAKLAYTLVDQFGQAETTGVYRATVSASDASTQVNSTVLVTGVAGKFDVNFADNSTKAGNYTVSVNVYKYDATALTWGSTAVATTTTTVVYVNATVASTLTASEPTAAVATSTTKVSALDRRVDTNSAAALDWGTAKHTISGVVSDATGAPVAGATVTITGAGFGFYATDVWTVGSATVNADASGAYTVDVYSNVAGKASVVVTSGTATKTVAVEYTGITTLDAKGTITLDVPSLSQVGRSVTVNVLVKDSLGNPVKSTDLISVSVTGVGSLSASKVSTDATGKATVQFVAGANDFGDAVIVAKYTNSDDTVVSATKTLTVGITDAQVDIVGKRVTAVASFTKGKTVAFYVDGIKKWSKLSASDADVVLNYNLKKGTHTITMKISGGFVTTEKFIVK